jgi:hypothetical protein
MNSNCNDESYPKDDGVNEYTEENERHCKHIYCSNVWKNAVCKSTVVKRPNVEKEREPEPPKQAPKN